MADTPIRELFYKSRIPDNVCQVILLFLFTPIGLMLVGIRAFILLLAYAVNILFPETTVIKRFVLKILSVPLGIVVIERKKNNVDKKNDVLMCNHVTLFDFIPLHCATGCVTPRISNIIFPMTWGLTDFGYDKGREVYKGMMLSHIMTKKEPLLIFPEEETTNGRVGMLKFVPWYSCLSLRVQPMCIKVTRPVLKIAPNVIGSTPYLEFFWFLFAPFTVFEITYLTSAVQFLEESDEQFMERVELAISKELFLERTEYTSYEKAECVKKVMAEDVVRRKLGSDFYDLRSTREYQYIMAHRVAEILPNVPMGVILNDLRRTRDVDVTISNILEGIVNFTPVAPPQDPIDPNLIISDAIDIPKNERPPRQRVVNFPDSVQDRMANLAQRRSKLLQSAKEKYLMKRRSSFDL